MKNTTRLCLAAIVFIGLFMSSCAPKQTCWAYRSTQHYSKKNKKTPSRVAAKGYFGKGARIATYAY